jgi:glyoxylase-like metal-dependent hydrolase (beta-lactamase superfamily II)
MKPKTHRITSLAGIAALFITAIAQAQSVDQLPNYVPVLPQVKAAALAVDPEKGYRVIEAKPGIFMITDGGYESTFVVTGKGVILFDAPASFAKHIVQAAADVTEEPIVGLVYSHGHVDHIGGAGRIREQIPNVEIWAEEGTAEFLREARDPDRPIPTKRNGLSSADSTP